jgi:putative oxidoreductase
LAGHRYWQIEDPQQRAQQRAHFLKNVTMLGGLLIAAADTGGTPVSGNALHDPATAYGNSID